MIKLSKASLNAIEKKAKEITGGNFDKRARIALDNGDIRFGKAYREQLDRDDKTATERLKGSISSAGATIKGEKIKGGVLAFEYALAVEFGRKAGKFPPLDPLIPWAVARNIVSAITPTMTFDSARRGTKEQRAEAGIIFAIAKKIATKGSKGSKSFQKVERSQSSRIYSSAFKQAFS